MIHEASAVLKMNDQPCAVSVKQCRHGRMCYFQHDYYIGGALERYGEYNHAELERLLKLTKAGDVIVEVGSNIGCHTVPLAQHVGNSGRVYAFEPQRVLYHMLCGNLATNGIWNVYTHFAAVGSHGGYTYAPYVDYTKLGNFGGVSMGGGNDPVELLTLDSLNLTRLNLLKIDVEGMESEVLAGAGHTITRLRPVIYIENDRKDKEKALIASLNRLDYDMWWSITPMFNPDNYRSNPVNEYGNTVSVDMVCIPSEKHATVDLPKVEGGLSVA